MRPIPSIFSPYRIIHGRHEENYESKGGTPENSQEMAVMPAPLTNDIAQAAYQFWMDSVSTEALAANAAVKAAAAQAAEAANPMIGRTVKMLFDMDDGSVKAYRGRIEQIDSNSDEPVKVVFEDGDVDNFTMEDANRALVEPDDA